MHILLRVGCVTALRFQGRLVINNRKKLKPGLLSIFQFDMVFTGA